MNQILDEVEKVLIPKKTFSKAAFGTALVSFILVFYYIVKYYTSDIGKPFIYPMFPLIVVSSCFSGFVFSIISFIKKEPSSFIKWVAAIINILPLLILILINIYDIMK